MAMNNTMTNTVSMPAPALSAVVIRSRFAAGSMGTCEPALGLDADLAPVLRESGTSSGRFRVEPMTESADICDDKLVSGRVASKVQSGSYLLSDTRGTIPSGSVPSHPALSAGGATTTLCSCCSRRGGQLGVDTCSRARD